MDRCRLWASGFGPRASCGLRAATLASCLTLPAVVAAQPPATKPSARTAAVAAADPRVAQGEAALAAGDIDGALALATAAAGARRASAKAHVLLARVQIARGALEPAWQSLDRAIALEPRNVDALAYMGFVGGKLAASTFERLKAEAPDSARVKQLEAEAFELQDRRDEAEAAYEAALAADPKLLDALLSLARMKRGRLACDEAASLYERAEAVRPTFDSAYGLGFCRSYLQEDDKAIAAYELAVTRDPAAAVAWSGLGQARVKAGRTAAGIEALERAVGIEPRMSDGWYMLGMAYQSAGDAEKSKLAFAKAAELRVGGKR
jgi:tetratricopeptide (TPR) repeat protein